MVLGVTFKDAYTGEIGVLKNVYLAGTITL
jgi:hypothetical protein